VAPASTELGKASLTAGAKEEAKRSNSVSVRFVNVRFGYHADREILHGVSFEIPESTGDITGLGVTRLLEALRTSELPAKF
jgi:GDP-D-mannose dehydratase